MVTITMPSNKFQRIIRDLAQISDVVTISCAKDSVCFATTGDIGTGAVRVNQTSGSDKPEEAVTVTMEESISLPFSLKTLNHFAKATPLASHVKLQMSTGVPLLVEYTIKDENDSEVGYIRYYLAPRVDDSD